jgi:hypothetical protein
MASQSRIFNRVVLTTNGILLPSAPDELWEYVDLIEVSLYPATAEKLMKCLETLTRKAIETGTDLSIYPRYTFQHINFSSRVSEDITEVVYENCYFKNYCHTLSFGRFYRCAPSASNRHYLRHFLPDADNEDDFVDLSTPDLRKALIEFLEKGTPLVACNFCAGSSGSSFSHSMARKDDALLPNHFDPRKLRI